MAKTDLKITSVQNLKEYSKGAVVELPCFAEGQPFVARVKRPSLMNLVMRGKIPNPLLTCVNDMFLNDGKNLDEADEDALKNLYSVLEIVAEESLVEPTKEQLEELGLELTDQQLMYLFNYSQQGVEMLENFRKK